VSYRVGIGFDLHRLVEGRPLLLGGVKFDGELGLLGHSDADVVLHAICDAMLGAAGLGDIGEHFPDDDPELEGANSADLLLRVLEMVRRVGYDPVNVDVNVIAEYPRLGPRKDEMRRRVAALLGITSERVGVKARSMEGIGTIGNKKAVAAQAVVLLELRAGAGSI